MTSARANRPPSPTFTHVVITCEHASNAVPRELAPRFRRATKALDSHRGWDPGAPPLARALAQALNAPLFTGKFSRLVVDLNRSACRPAVFSEFTRPLDPVRRALLLDRYHAPHWHAVESEIARAIDEDAVVLHVGVHSFTPVLHGVRRTADFALLYDPQRPLERDLCARWLEDLAHHAPSLRLRRNYPYLGTADGLTTALRKRFPHDRYAGIEIELNQALLKGTTTLPRRVSDAIVRSLEQMLNG
ncbi:MAG: N-formylglutamate amidohydrolase [Phycisphaerales bacterium]